ncbi:MAG TPA: tetratricopeptide repeat protein [Steroidobacteraceae bacterium]|nr:tetratricopeptide repeat protein [Steroidobacteraceae bacterium]
MRHLSQEFRAFAADAMAHFQAGRLKEAERAYRAALGIVRADPVVTHNLGVAIAAQGRHKAAVACFDDALRADPGFVSAHYNRAVALLRLNETAEAIQAFSRAAALEPEHYEAHRALGFLWLGQGERGRALDHLARTYELRRGDDRTAIARTSLTKATRHKVEHDAEQFLYLSRRRRDRLRFEMLARNYRAVAAQLPDHVSTLSEAQIEALGDDYNTPIHLRAAPEVPGNAVSERADAGSLKAQFNAQGAIFVDDLLTATALDSLHQFLLESTIWHDFSHIDGFVASYLEDGLASPLLLQIADDLRQAFPDILGPHPLSQAWAFKGLKPQAAVDAHADDAAVSVNFWVTPTEANRACERGGLAVCLAPPPADWKIKDYDADQARIVTFLEQNVGSSLVIPYRQNRAVLFRSRLFHHSDRPEFATGHENHRINLTLLYGA